MAQEEEGLRDFMRAQFDRMHSLAFEREERADARSAKLEKRLDSVDARIERLTRSIEVLAENVSTLDSSMVGVLQHITNANTAHARESRELAELRARVDELERRLPAAQ